MTEQNKTPKGKKIILPKPEEMIVNAAGISSSERYKDVYTETSPGGMTNWERKGNVFLFQSEQHIDLKVEVLTGTIWRFRYALRGDFAADFSYAIAPNFEPKRTGVVVDDLEEYVAINTSSNTTCRIYKSDLRVEMLDALEKIICSDEAPFYAKSTLLEGTTELKITKSLVKNEHFFGLGDKSCRLNLRGRKFENWNTDSFAYTDKTDPLYRSIPFYLGLRDGVGYGIFMDNSYRSFFDFDSEKKGKSISFSAAGGEMNYYFIFGPELLSVAEQYTDLTGRPELPPLWSLGFHQCRWSYHPDSRVREVANEFRERQIPCDAIYLDIDYMDDYRCFTWDAEKFPAPEQLIDDLADDGFQTIVMIDPGIKVDNDYPVFKELKANDYWCRRTTGEPMIGPVWPPECAFPDFTKAEVRHWWGNWYEHLYKNQKVSGFWNDMNEPAVFKVTIATFPDNVLHHYDGHGGDHKKAHNIYGMQMSRATVEGLKRLRPEKRPFLVTRATYSGGQRFAAIWTGDNVASWEHLRIANRQAQRLSASGFSFTGSDIGGFVDQPTGELMVRWLQLGIFHPFFRIHSMGNNADGAAEALKDKIDKAEKENRMDQEPWSYGDEYTDLARAAIELRYQLLPYLYTTFWQYTQRGTPVLRSIRMTHQHDAHALVCEYEFFWGDHILAAPVVEKGLDKVEIYLPEGQWFKSGSNMLFVGKNNVTLPVALDDIPMFVRAGAIIPKYPVMQYTNERAVEELTLQTYFSIDRVTSELYEDAGEGYGYETGDFSHKKWVTSIQDHRFVIQQEKKGEREDSYTTVRLQLFGLPKAVQSILVDGKSVDFMTKEQAIEAIIPSFFAKVEVVFE